MRTVTVVGLGLIGGSILRALRRAGYAPRGYDTDPATRAAARRADTGWQIADDLATAVRGADLVLLAVPLPALPGVLDELAGLDEPAGHDEPAGCPGLVTDAISVKQPVRQAVRDRWPNARFVGGHPMAGREKAGFDAGDAALFDDRAWVLCLDPGTRLDDWLTVARLVTVLGARVVPTTAAEHDDAAARISHLPHLTAAALAAGADTPLAAALGAGSFRDGTRVAAGPPALSAAICGGNADALRVALDTLLADLSAARAALDGTDPIGALTDWFRPGHAVRSQWPPAPGRRSTLRPDAAALLALGRAGGWVNAVDPDTGELSVTHPA